MCRLNAFLARNTIDVMCYSYCITRRYRVLSHHWWCLILNTLLSSCLLGFPTIKSSFFLLYLVTLLCRKICKTVISCSLSDLCLQAFGDLCLNQSLYEGCYVHLLVNFVLKMDVSFLPHAFIYSFTYLYQYVLTSIQWVLLVIILLNFTLVLKSS